MGLSYKQDSVPSTLREGEFAVVDGVTYVGNSSNEPVLAKGYKEYVALLSQGGTDAPDETLIKSDIESITYSRSSTGEYDATFSSSFPDPDKISVLFGYSGTDDDLDVTIGYNITGVDGQADKVTFYTTVNGSLTDGFLQGSVLIRIYD